MMNLGQVSALGMPLPMASRAKAAATILGCLTLILMARSMPVESERVWHEEIQVEAPFDMSAIRIPVFPDREFVVTGLGAVEGSDTNISEAIHRAITACHKAGGAGW